MARLQRPCTRSPNKVRLSSSVHGRGLLMRTAISTHFYSSRGYHQGQVRRLSPTQNWTRRLGSSQFGRGKYPDVTKADGLGMGGRKVNVDAILSAVYRVRVRRSVLLVNSNALVFVLALMYVNCCQCVMEPSCLSRDWRQLPFALVAPR